MSFSVVSSFFLCPCRSSYCLSNSFSSLNLAYWELSTCLTLANSLCVSLSLSTRVPISTTPLDLVILIQVWVRALSSSSARNNGTVNF